MWFQGHLVHLFLMILLNGIFIFPLGMSKPYHSLNDPPELDDRHIVNPFTQEEYEALQKNLNAHPLSENIFASGDEITTTTFRPPLQRTTRKNIRRNRNEQSIPQYEEGKIREEYKINTGEDSTRRGDLSKWLIFSP